MSDASNQLSVISCAPTAIPPEEDLQAMLGGAPALSIRVRTLPS